jgi:hypothetical protein
MFLSLYDEVTNVLHICVSLKQRITTAVASVDEEMLRSVWTELDYRIDICHVILGQRPLKPMWPPR